MSAQDLDDLLAAIRLCRICRDAPWKAPLPHEPRPVLQASSGARLFIVGQAPGTKVHASGRPFMAPNAPLNFPSGMSPTSSANIVKIIRMRKPLTRSGVIGTPSASGRPSMLRLRRASVPATPRVTSAARRLGSRVRGSSQIARNRSRTSGRRRSSIVTR